VFVLARAGIRQHSRMDANTNDFLGQLTITCINPSLSSLALPFCSTTPDWNPTQLKSSTVAI
jgi:hypothetical protein